MDTFIGACQVPVCCGARCGCALLRVLALIDRVRAAPCCAWRELHEYGMKTATTERTHCHLRSLWQWLGLTCLCELLGVVS